MPTPAILPVVTDLATAETVADAFDAVVSLVAGEEGTVLAEHANRLYCPFDDVAFDDDPYAITVADAATILDFATGRTGSLLVHCLAGQSRSTAAALAIAVARGFDPFVAAATLLDRHLPGRPFIPNPLVLVRFDEALDLKGVLVEAGMEYLRF